MNSQSFKITFILFIVSQLVNVTRAEVIPPNYNFSLDSFKPFYPGQSLEEIQQKYGKGTLMNKKGQTTTYRFYVSQIRYKFPVFVTVYEGKSLDFVAKLPSYFSHDVYHRSLIKRFGKQDKFSQSDGTSVYTWKNKEGNKLIYTGTCTITCFPIYFSAEMVDAPEVPGYRPLLYQLEESSLF